MTVFPPSSACCVPGAHDRLTGRADARPTPGAPVSGQVRATLRGGAGAQRWRRNCRRWAVLALAAGLTLAACHVEGEARGRVVYDQHCRRCHGPDGQGQNLAKPWGSLAPEVEGFIAPALDGRGHCWFHPPHEIFGIVKNGSGVPGSPMPAWGSVLPDSDIRSVTAYIQSLWPRRLRFLAEQMSPQDLERLRGDIARKQASP